MSWMVTKDFTEDETGKNPKEVKVMSRDFKLGQSLPHLFRMFDDDGFLCYEGWSSDSDSERAFAPLDDYGMPNVGCTYIQYLRPMGWETL